MLNPFIPRDWKFNIPVHDTPLDIVTLELKDVVVKVSDDDTKSEDFVVEKIAEETSRVSAYEYMMSFADDVGIENILKKLALTGDVSLINQRKRQSLPVDENGYEPLQDYTQAPSDVLEAADVVLKGYQSFDKLPADLVGSKSFRQFVETATAEDVKAYVQKVLASKNEGGKE